MRNRSDTSAQRYAEARRALNENYLADMAAGIREETDEYLRLNDECWDAEQALPRWRSWLIDRRVSREQRFRRRLARAERQGGLRLLVVLLAAALAAVALTGCMGKHACDHHGGLSHEVKGIFICNDGHRVGGLSGL
jgi:hypothetical protein